MRATISFETDVDQVEGTMAVVACSEEHNLRAAADILSNYTVLDGSLLDSISEVLRLLDKSAVQLRQYQQMLVSFEKARFETMLPQEATAVNSLRDVQEAVQVMNKFDGFLDRINTEAEESSEENEEG
jgi:hypothetical protein